jgi:hypothetical protein
MTMYHLCVPSCSIRRRKKKGMKTAFSDLLVQKVVERREYIDWNRNGAFATFGLLYLGGVQYFLYGTSVRVIVAAAAVPLGWIMLDHWLTFWLIGGKK